MLKYLMKKFGARATASIIMAMILIVIILFIGIFSLDPDAGRVLFLSLFSLILFIGLWHIIVFALKEYRDNDK